MRWNTISAVAALVVLGATASCSSDSLNILTPAWARAITQDSYLFGLPLVYIAVEHAPAPGDQSSPAGDPS
jgi:hypothetical protein